MIENQFYLCSIYIDLFYFSTFLTAQFLQFENKIPYLLIQYKMIQKWKNHLLTARQ